MGRVWQRQVVAAEGRDLPELPRQGLVYSRDLAQAPDRTGRGAAFDVGVGGDGGCRVAEVRRFPGTSAIRATSSRFWIDRYSQVLRRHGGDRERSQLASRFAAAGIPVAGVSVVQRAFLDDEAKPFRC